MEYYIFWALADGTREERCDEPFDSREEAEAEIELMKADDAKCDEAGMWVYRIEEYEKNDEDGKDGVLGGLECGDHPDERSVVCAGADGRNYVRRFGSAYQREMWEIGMRESDFC